MIFSDLANNALDPVVGRSHYNSLLRRKVTYIKNVIIVADKEDNFIFDDRWLIERIQFRAIVNMYMRIMIPIKSLDTYTKPFTSVS